MIRKKDCHNLVPNSSILKGSKCSIFRTLCNFFFTLLLILSLQSCNKIDLFEKVVPIPGHQWKGTYKPVFKFSITDTTSPYQLFLIVRHTNKYNYNNIWIRMRTSSPDSTVSSAEYELPLATNEKGWLGTGLDDIYEHRIALTPLNRNFLFKKTGTYAFSIEHIMREDPLEHFMNIGLRIEKKSR